MKISMKRIPKTTDWVEGTAGKYGFQALVFEENSCYGIEEGRVSKLYIWKGEGASKKYIAEYDRGWGKEPSTEEEKRAFRAIWEFLERHKRNQQPAPEVTRAERKNKMETTLKNAIANLLITIEENKDALAALKDSEIEALSVYDALTADAETLKEFISL